MQYFLQDQSSPDGKKLNVLWLLLKMVIQRYLCFIGDGWCVMCLILEDDQACVFYHMVSYAGGSRDELSVKEIGNVDINMDVFE